MDSFYTQEELYQLGLKKVGKEVKISKKASIYSPQNIEIGDYVRIDDFTIISGTIKIGNYVHIAAYTALYGGGKIIIDDYCGCSPRCTLLSASDDFSGEYMISPMVPEELTHVIKGEINLNRFVQIGANSVVFPGVTIKEGTAVGAMSLVNQSLEGWGIYAGIPCKRIKERQQNLKELEKKIKKGE